MKPDPTKLGTHPETKLVADESMAENNWLPTIGDSISEQIDCIKNTVAPWCVILDDIMFWVPTDIIKILWAAEIQIPKTFVLGEFAQHNSIINASLEFPLFNFLFKQEWFFKWEKLKVVWTNSQIERMKRILHISLLWPTDEQYEKWWVDKEYITMMKGIANAIALKKQDGSWEIAQITDMIEFIAFDEKWVVVTDGKMVTKTWPNQFDVKKEDELKMQSVDITITRDQLNQIETRFKWEHKPVSRSALSLTPLDDCNSWFALESWTTGLLFCANWNYIPVDWSDAMHLALDELWISPGELIWYVITHIHDDHFSSIVRILLKWNTARILTTDLIYRMIVAKAADILGKPEDYIEKLTKNIELKPWEGVRWYWATYTSWHTVHPIPTIWLKLEVNDHSVVIGWDTMYWTQLNDLVASWVIPNDMAHSINTCFKGADLSVLDWWWWLIHPSVDELKAAIGEEDQARILITHAPVNEEYLMKNVKPLQTYDIVPSRETIASDDFLTANNSDILWWLSINWKRVLSAQAVIGNYINWEEIVRQWEKWWDFYLLIWWSASVFKDGKQVAKLESWDYFGAMSILDNSDQNVTVVSNKNTKVFKIPRDIFSDIANFAHFEDWSIVDNLRKINELRPVFEKFDFFKKIETEKHKNRILKYSKTSNLWNSDILKNSEKISVIWVLKWKVSIIVRNKDWKFIKSIDLADWEVLWEMPNIDNTNHTVEIISQSSDSEIFTISETDFIKVSTEIPLFIDLLEPKDQAA